MSGTLSRWWDLDLAARYPGIEMYHGGWRGDQETALLELGDRVMNHEAAQLPVYTREMDRVWALVLTLYATVLQRIRDQRPLEDKVLACLRGEPLTVSPDEVPAGWRPDTGGWDAEDKRAERGRDG